MAHIRWIAGWSAILKLIGAQIWCVIPWSGCLIYRILVCVCVFPTHLNLSMIYIYIYIIIYMIYDNIGRVFVLVNYCMYPTHEFVLLFAFVDPIEDGWEGKRPIFVGKLNWRNTNLHENSHCVCVCVCQLVFEHLVCPLFVAPASTLGILLPVF